MVRFVLENGIFKKAREFFEKNASLSRKKDMNRDSHIASSLISQSFFRVGTLLDFGLLTEEASWIHRIF